MSSVGQSRPIAAVAVVVTLAGGLVAVGAPSASAAACAANTYTRQFFANTALTGAAKRTDCDGAISENWGAGTPGVTGIGKDGFGVRWQTTRDFGSGGPFTFTASGQDGIRVHLDGVRKIDLWKNGTTTVSKTVNLTIPKGTHTLRVDYVNWTGSAAVTFAYTPRTGEGVDKVAPLTPGGATIARDAGTKRNVLRWSANKELDLAGYRVYRRTPGESSFGSPVATVTGTTFTDSTAGSATHLYEVRAVDRSGNASGGSADVSVTGNPVFLRQYFANSTLTGTPKRTDTDGTIHENWGAGTPGVTGIGKDGFGVRWQTTRDFGSGGPFTFTASGQDGIRVHLDGVRKIDLWKNGTTTVSKTVNLTIPKGTHVLRVDYVNWTGSAAVTFAYTPRTGEGVDTIAPLTPTGVKAVYDPAHDSAALSWAPNKEMDLAYYQVYRRTAVGDWAPVAFVQKTSWTATGLRRDGRPVEFYVAVSDRAGNLSGSSPVVTVTPVDTVVPPAPVIAVSHLANSPRSLKINLDAPTEAELRAGGTVQVYRSTGDTLGDDPERLTSLSSVGYVYVDELPAFDGTAYTYAVSVTDAAGNVSPLSAARTVTPDSVPPAPLTGLTATPRGDGVVLSWDAPAESRLTHAAARVVRRADGTVTYDSDGCHDARALGIAGDLPNTMLCAGPADGETVTFVVVPVDPWGNATPFADLPTVTTTELDGRPADARDEDTGPISILNRAVLASRTGTVQWICADEAACAAITTFRVERWNAATGAYDLLGAVPSIPLRTYHAVVRNTLGVTAYFRITGVAADGTTAAVAHFASARGAYL
ncbi:PA14 domain-containing protein [uncultured Streptomyces sp.]|uniref:PA14 domain-containing protein n=1 Tax=uncultured Streptomyces sp. TaxID=174707 RepID=UPI002611177B|nr:PA14 domain-containing protein [uncultured Streptomyces sp.]